MKTLLVASLILALIAGIAVYVFPNAKALAKQSVNDTNKWFGKKVNDGTAGDEAEQEYYKHEEYLREKYIMVAAEKENLGKRQAELDTKKNQLVREKAIVQKANDWLTSHGEGDFLLLGGIKYSYANVASDARSRVEQYKALQGTIGDLEKTVQMMDGTVKKAEKDITNALVLVKQKLGELGAKRAQLAALRVVKETMDIAKSISIDNGNVEAVSTHFNAQIDSRIRELKADLEFEELASRTTGGIPWDNPGSGASVSSDLTIVRDFLNEPAPAATPPVESESGIPDLSELLETPATPPAVS